MMIFNETNKTVSEALKNAKKHMTMCQIRAHACTPQGFDCLYLQPTLAVREASGLLPAVSGISLWEYQCDCGQKFKLSSI